MTDKELERAKECAIYQEKADRDREIFYADVEKDKLNYYGDGTKHSGFKRVIDKYMLLKKDGKAMHIMGDISRDYYDAELIHVYNESNNSWIGQFCEGFGFFDVKFDKEACREATTEEVEMFAKGKGEEVRF